MAFASAVKVPRFIHLLDRFINKCYNLIEIFLNVCRQNTTVTFHLLVSNGMKYMPNMMFIKDEIMSKALKSHFQKSFTYFP